MWGGESRWLLSLVVGLVRWLGEACGDGVSLEGEAVLGADGGLACRYHLPARHRSLLLCERATACSMRAAQIRSVRLLPICLPCLLRLPPACASSSKGTASSATRGILGVLDRCNIESAFHFILVFESPRICNSFLRILGGFL